MSNAGKIEEIKYKRASLELENKLLKTSRGVKVIQLTRMNETIDQLSAEIRRIDVRHSENVDEFIRLGQELKEIEAKNNIYTPG